MVSAPLIVLLYDRTFLAGSFREAWRTARRILPGLGRHVVVAGLAGDLCGQPRRLGRFWRGNKLVGIPLHAIRRDRPLPAVVRVAPSTGAGLRHRHCAWRFGDPALCDRTRVARGGHGRGVVAVAESRFSGGVVLCHLGADFQCRSGGDADGCGTSDVPAAGGGADGFGGWRRCFGSAAGASAEDFTAPIAGCEHFPGDVCGGRVGNRHFPTQCNLP